MATLLSPESMDVVARELGVSGIVGREGWGGVPARECGRVVHVAIRIAEEALLRREGPTAHAGHPARRF